MSRHVVLVASLVLVAGCPSAPPPPDAAIEEVEVAPPPDALVDVTLDERETRAPAALVLPAGFPADWPVYPGAIATDAAEPGEADFVVFLAPEPISTVRNRYETMLGQRGWRRVGGDSDEGRWRRDGVEVRVTLSPAAPSTEIRVEY